MWRRLRHIVARLFLQVYDTAVDTVFLCFLVDEKQNKSSGCMLADEGLKEVVSNYEDVAKERVESRPRFRRKTEKRAHLQRMEMGRDAGTRSIQTSSGKNSEEVYV